jgi:hypothetical protein
MKLRLAVMLAFLASASAPVGAAAAQAATDSDGVRTLLQRLERIVAAGDTPAYAAQLSETADRAAALAFAGTELVPGATRVVIREREREPLAGTLPGNGYRILVDVFTEFGNRARSATWRLDVKRIGLGSDEIWRIADQQRLTLVDGLNRLSLQPSKQFTVHDLSIPAEDFELALAEGSAFVAETDQGVTGLVLLGKGEVRFHPAPEIEKGQLRIFCGSEALQTRFDAAFVRINPQDAALVSMTHLTPRPVDPRAFRRADALFRDEVEESYAVDMGDLSRDLWSLMPAAGDFLAEIRTERYDTLTYAVSSSEPEDVSLFDRKRHRNIAIYASRRALARHGRSFSEDDSADYDVLGYDLDVTVSPDRQWIDGRALVQLRVRAPVISSLTLRLADSLVVQSIVSDQFGWLSGVRVRDQNSIIVNLPSSVLRDEELLLTVTYAGRIEPQREDPEAVAASGQTRPSLPSGPDDIVPLQLQLERSFLYSSRSYWYPQGMVTGYATASIRVTVPAAFDCVASGELDAGFPTAVPGRNGAPPGKVYLFTTAGPLRYLAFIVSRFVRSEPVSVALDSGDPFTLEVQTNPRQVHAARELGERAGNIVQFYESIVGEAPYPSLTLAVVESEVPGGHSPGYFVALNQPLPNTRYVWHNDPASFEGYPEFFLAHEIAHQWWGQAVGWRNYHEQWLSEGFAQYFAALYARRLRGDETFAGMLRQFREWGMRESDQGPIYLGYRLGHIRGDSRIFRAVVYNKSAAVLHMLRRLVGDEAFFRGIRRFYRLSRFHKVGTDDFRAAMEAETGRPLGRFFERWIYGSRLPHLKVSYHLEAGTAGQQVVIHVEQIGDVFDVPLTVTVHCADRRDVRVNVAVTERFVDMPVTLAGAVRGIDVSKDDGTLADIVKN